MLKTSGADMHTFVAFYGSEAYSLRGTGSTKNISRSVFFSLFLNAPRFGNTSPYPCRLRSLSHMRNVTTVSIEGSPYDKHGDVWGVPYPTSFHPSTDQDVLTWQAYVRSYPRQKLVVYAGRDHGMGGKIREALFRLCKSAAPECNAVHCCKRRCMKAVGLAEMYLGAHFCLQPPGDTPTRKALFDCMVMGGIPVVFNADTSYT